VMVPAEEREKLMLAVAAGKVGISLLGNPAGLPERPRPFTAQDYLGVGRR
jgi:hypothetical protein